MTLDKALESPEQKVSRPAGRVDHSEARAIMALEVQLIDGQLESAIEKEGLDELRRLEQCLDLPHVRRQILVEIT